MTGDTTPAPADAFDAWWYAQPGGFAYGRNYDISYAAWLAGRADAAAADRRKLAAVIREIWGQPTGEMIANAIIREMWPGLGWPLLDGDTP